MTNPPYKSQRYNITAQVKPEKWRIIAQTVAVDFAPNPVEHYDNAQFIVRACNAHDELVAALRDILDNYSTYSGTGETFITFNAEELAAARAALDKATA